MNTKLRLLVTGKCHNKCPLCCNNRFDFTELQVVDPDISRYDEINITGGEPLLFPAKLLSLLLFFRGLEEYTGRKQVLYLYTSVLPHKGMLDSSILTLLDGICYTPHTVEAAKEFLEYEKYVRNIAVMTTNRLNSLRLNVFPEVEKVLGDLSDLPMWKVKKIQWLKDCPVPEGEDFRRIANLW